MESALGRLIKFCERKGASNDIITWMQDQHNFATAWSSCEYPDLMFWILGLLDVDCVTIVQMACACARTALKFVPDEESHPRIVIETVEAWCEGTATVEEVKDATDAAYEVTADVTLVAYEVTADVTYAAFAACDSGAYAAHAAAYTTGHACCVAFTTGVGAFTASYAARVAKYASEAASYAARVVGSVPHVAADAVSRDMCDIIRSHIGGMDIERMIPT